MTFMSYLAVAAPVFGISYALSVWFFGGPEPEVPDYEEFSSTIDRGSQYNVEGTCQECGMDDEPVSSNSLLCVWCKEKRNLDSHVTRQKMIRRR